LIAAFVLVVATVVLLAIAFVLIRRRRGQRPASGPAATGSDHLPGAGDVPIAGAGGVPPYATLADPSDERDATDAETTTDASGSPPDDTGDAS
jgi:hypothetical protein